jgi:glycosyltransferase involved in cell wall biosynthesis
VLFVVFHVLAPLTYLAHRRRHRTRFDVVYFHDVDLPFGDVTYVRFCNRAFLDRPDGVSPWTGLRPLARWIDHRLRALVEGVVLRRVRHIVVPSQGLAGELIRYCGAELGTKITLIPNFVPVGRLAQPTDLDVTPVRAELGFGPQDLVAAFVALGHYERKGLPLLLDALGRVDDPTLKLLIVGGTTAAVRPHLQQAAALGLGARVKMIETQTDTRPYLWAADLFVLPSRYETFSMVAYEAAAAGLPLLPTPVHGVVDLVEDGVNGWALQVDPDDIAQKLRWCAEHRDDLPAMGARAASKAAAFGEANFAARWRDYYGDLVGHPGGRQRTPERRHDSDERRLSAHG